MERTPTACRRREPRIETAVKIRFAVNGGPEHVSDTINFTTRSLAIRSHLPVAIGDLVTAHVDYLPPIEGAVARVWGDGFAIALGRDSAALVTLTRAEEEAREAEAVLDLDAALVGGAFEHRLTPIDAPHACWLSIISSTPLHMPGRRELLLVTTAPIRPEDIRSAWVLIGEMRSVVRLIGARRRHDHSLILLRINNWQLQNARQQPLAVTLVLNTLDAWVASTTPQTVEAHLADLAAKAA